MSDNLTRIKEIIIDKLGIEESKITTEARFIEDLGADSLDTVELIMQFEEEFDIEISDEDAEKLNTVGSSVDYINEKIKCEDRIMSIQNNKILKPFTLIELLVVIAIIAILAAMLLPTNDTFVSLNGVRLPRHGSVSYLADAYDAGSEPNDELCASVPGPTCGGEGYSPAVDGEGFVYPAPGTHGEGDLSVAQFGWSGPVAKVTITRLD